MPTYINIGAAGCPRSCHRGSASSHGPSYAICKWRHFAKIFAEKTQNTFLKRGRLASKARPRDARLFRPRPQPLPAGQSITSSSLLATLAT